MWVGLIQSFEGLAGTKRLTFLSKRELFLPCCLLSYFWTQTKTWAHLGLQPAAFWIRTTSAFLSLQLAVCRSWDFSASISGEPIPYNKSLSVYIHPIGSVSLENTITFSYLLVDCSSSHCFFFFTIIKDLSFSDGFHQLHCICFLHLSLISTL